MRRRPWALIILAVLHLFAPLGNVVFNAVVQNRNVFQYLIYAMSPDYVLRNWVILVAPVVAGIAIYACKRWSIYLYFAAITALMLDSYFSYLAKGGSMGILPLLLVYLVNIGVVAYFLLPEVRAVYFDRRMRWWEIQARYKTNFRCQWKKLEGNDQQAGMVANFSENGLFLKSDIHVARKD